MEDGKGWGWTGKPNHLVKRIFLNFVLSRFYCSWFYKKLLALHLELLIQVNIYFIGEHLSCEVCWWCKLILVSEGNWRIAEAFYEMEIMPYVEAATTCGSVILSRGWEKGELCLGITYITAWAFAFGHCWKWQSGLVWPLSVTVQYSYVLRSFRKDNVLKKPKKLFRAWERTKEWKSMKRRKNKWITHT